MTKDLPRAALLPFLLAASGAAAAEAPTRAASTAPQFGPYDLVRELGRGEMGAVYLAKERDGEQRQVALKVAHAPPASSALRAQLAFEREALASLAHEHVVRLFDAGTTPDGHPWLAMEYVDGEPIDAWCAARALPVEARVRLLADVARAVQHLHERGVAHRDLKPQNILVTEIDGRPVPKLIDLGFAALHGNDARDQVVVGTPAYMAPELFTDPAPSLPRADVFALGVVAHEVILGAAPFRDARVRHGVVELGKVALPGIEEIPVDCEVRALLRSGLATVFQTSLASDPGQRPGDAGALAAALERVLARTTHGAGWRAWIARGVAWLRGQS